MQDRRLPELSGVERIVKACAPNKNTTFSTESAEPGITSQLYKAPPQLGAELPSSTLGDLRPYGKRPFSVVLVALGLDGFSICDQVTMHLRWRDFSG